MVCYPLICCLLFMISFDTLHFVRYPLVHCLLTLDTFNIRWNIIHYSLMRFLSHSETSFVLRVVFETSFSFIHCLLCYNDTFSVVHLACCLFSAKTLFAMWGYVFSWYTAFDTVFYNPLVCFWLIPYRLITCLVSAAMLPYDMFVASWHIVHSIIIISSLLSVDVLFVLSVYYLAMP